MTNGSISLAGLRPTTEILAQALATCQNLHMRPMMYVGYRDRESSAPEIDMAFWIAYSHFLFIQTREAELGDVVCEIKQEHGFASLSFVDSFRAGNPDASHEQVFDATMGFWATVAERLGVDPNCKPDFTQSQDGG